MTLDFAISQLRRGPASYEAITQGLDAEEFLWRPGPGKWSVLEVLCHLADEEREDFRKRLDLTLHQPDQPWPGIDPEAWVTERAYQERDPQASLEDFLAERARSLAWLDTLVEPDFERAKQHPALGTMRAGDFLVSWAAHDLLHLRQIVILRLGWMKVAATPFNMDYASP